MKARAGKRRPPARSGVQRARSKAAAGAPVRRRPAAAVRAADREMWASYAGLEIHEQMLRDVPRTDAYRRAVLAGRREHFLGKTVLDVGCGVGILSLFAARLGGAKRVYAVEACAETAARARRVVSANGLSRIVRVICGAIEKVRLPTKVDTIVSEWMGYFLLHESMLGSVLFARDRWLRKGGVMYPSRARLLASPGDFREQLEEKAGFWGTNVYGFDLSTLRTEAEAKVRAETPLWVHLRPGQILERRPRVVADWDLATCGPEDVRRAEASFVSRATRKRVVNGFAIWFDVSFPTRPAVVLGTGPRNPRTHWGQSLALVEHELSLRPGEGVDWCLSLTENSENYRYYDLNVDYGLLSDEEGQ